MPEMARQTVQPSAGGQAAQAAPRAADHWPWDEGWAAFLAVKRAQVRTSSTYQKIILQRRWIEAWRATCQRRRKLDPLATVET